jgi:tetratricopeptide (TPR) repeat protein
MAIFSAMSFSRLKPVVFGLLVFLSLQSWSQSARSQQEIIDSLRHIADTSAGIGRANALRILASEMMALGMPNAAEPYFSMMREALEILEKHGDTVSVIACHCTLGRELAEAGFFLEGMAHAGKAMDLAPARDSLLRSMIFRIYAIAYRGLEVYDSALYFLEEAQEYIPDTFFCDYAASTLNDLGQILTRMGDQRAALEVYRQAYGILEACPGQVSNFALGSAARALGYTLMTSGDYRAALHYFRVADTVYEHSDMGVNRNKIYHAQQASNMARVYQHWGKLDSALYYRQLALSRFAAYGITEQNMNVPNQYCYMGSIYREKGDFSRASEYFQRSLELRKQIHDSLGVGMCLDEMAEMARARGQYQKAIQMLEEALYWKSYFDAGRTDPRRGAQQVESRAETYLLLGKVFAEWKKYDDALMYHDTAMMLYRQVYYNRGEALVAYERGRVWRLREMPDSSLLYFEKALAMADRLDNRPLRAKVLTGMGGLQFMMGDVNSALENYAIALGIYTQEGFIRELPGLQLKYGKALWKAGDPKQAVQMLDKAYTGSADMRMTGMRAEVALALSEIHENNGNFRLANLFLKECLLLHDSVFTIETHRQLAEMQALHESQQQQMQILRLSKENELNSLRAGRSQNAIISLGGIVVIILLFSILFIRQIRIRNQQKAMLVEQQLFRSQMNPHFIFNSLTNIQHYIFSKDPLAAGKYLAVFAKLMRNILDNSRLEQISLKSETETVIQYLDLQKLRMEEKLNYELIVDDTLDHGKTMVPPMLAQPFIENAVEHGIRNKEGAGHLYVRITKSGESIVYEVEDDGIGRKRAAVLREIQHKDHESMAVALTRSRLQNLWGMKRPRDFFEIIDKENEAGEPAGTLVRFKIPILMMK